MKEYSNNFISRAMFIVTFLLCAFCTTNLLAQVPNNVLETQEQPTDTFHGLTLTQEQLDEIKKYTPKQPECFNPDIENEAVVRYQTSALVYLKWHKSDGQANIYLQDGQKRTYRAVESEEGDLIFSKVPLEQSYQLIGKNSCGIESVFKTISTAHPTINEVTISDDFYNSITSWSINAKGVPLRRFLKELTKVNYYERLAFYQHHSLKNERLDESLANGEFPEVTSSDNSATSSLLSCDCTFLMNKRRIASPGRAVNYNFAVNDNFFANYSNGWYDVNTNTSRGYSITGPAKWQQQESGGYCTSNSTDWETDDSQSTNGSPYYATIGYNLMCTNYFQLPDDCVCEKEIRVKANYTTQLNTSAAVQRAFGVCWGSRGANASVEDWATLVEHKIRTAQVTVLQGGRTNASSNCNSSLNTTFFVNYLKLALTVGGKILEIQAAQNGGNTAVNNFLPGDFIDDLSGKFSDLINTPFRNSEPCGSEQKDAQLINYEAIHKIVPNNPVEFTLNSFSKLHTYGYTRWTASARIISKFMISSILNPQGSKPACCSAPMANWISSTISPDFSSIRPVVQDFINFWWPVPGPKPTVTTDFGGFNGPTPFNCIAPGDFKGGNTPTNFTVRSPVDGVYLKQKAINQPYECLISDIMGRIVHRYKGNGMEEKVWDYSDASNMPLTGIYLVQVKASNGDFQTFKIVKK